MTGAEHLQSFGDDVAIHVEFYINNGLIARTLATHTPDPSGHCAGCTWYEAARPTWPCSHAYYAGLARRLQHPSAGTQS